MLLSPLVRKYGKYCIPSKTNESWAETAFVIGKEGNRTCDGGRFAWIVVEEEARVGFVDFAAEPEDRVRRVDLQRVTIVEQKHWQNDQF